MFLSKKMNQQISSNLGNPPPFGGYSSTDSTFQTTNSMANLTFKQHMANSTFHLANGITDSTFQSANSTTYLLKRKLDEMTYEVEYTDEFEQSYIILDEDTQDTIDIVVELLQEKGPNLRFPHSSKVESSRHQHMRELRVQHQGKPYRILYAFDPRRVAVLLLVGNKKGNDRWYEENVPKADKLYAEHLKELDDEGLI